MKKGEKTVQTNSKKIACMQLVKQAETMGYIGMLLLRILGRPYNLAARELQPSGLSRIYSVLEMK